MEPIRVVALDLDGTLIDQHSKVASQTIDHLHKLGLRGVTVVLVTGRPFEAAVEILADNGLGASTGVPQYLICEERDIYALDQAEYTPWIERNTELYNTEKALLEPARAIASQLSESAPQFAFSINEPAAQEKRGFVELRCSDSLTARRILVELHNHLNDSSLHAVRNGRWIALRSRLAGKDKALAALIEHLEVPTQAVLVMGDSQNDVEMLKAFFPATTNNADAEVKTVVRQQGGIISASDSSLGVAEVLTQIFD